MGVRGLRQRKGCGKGPGGSSQVCSKLPSILSPFCRAQGDLPLCHRKNTSAGAGAPLSRKRKWQRRKWHSGTCSPVVSSVAGAGPCEDLGWSEGTRWGRRGSLRESVHLAGAVCCERSWPSGPACTALPRRLCAAAGHVTGARALEGAEAETTRRRSEAGAGLRTALCDTGPSASCQLSRPEDQVRPWGSVSESRGACFALGAVARGGGASAVPPLSRCGTRASRVTSEPLYSSVERR